VCAIRVIGYPLPEAIEEDLIAFCSTTGDDPAAVVIDAVTLFLDDAADAAETVPPACGVTGGGPREGYASSDVGDRFARLMAELLKLRGDVQAG
jgi:hypothetical protein